MKIYTNRAPDYVRNAFSTNAHNPKKLLLVSPFFSNSELIKDLVLKGCEIDLIVRFSERTPPSDLKEIISLRGVNICWFTAQSFHTKLYIFGDDVAVVGSANLTGSGMVSNQEVCVEIPSSDKAFLELKDLFESYWDDAKVLNDSILDDYTEVFANKPPNTGDAFEKQIKNKFGNIFLVYVVGLRTIILKATMGIIFKIKMISIHDFLRRSIN